MNDKYRMIPAAALSGGGQIEQGHPGKGRPFTASILVVPSYCISLAVSVLFLANLFASAFASKSSFHALFLTRLQVKGVALDLFNNVFLLHFALEATQSVLEGFTLLQPNFRQTDTPPNPSGRTGP
jgi:hypothetical protein